MSHVPIERGETVNVDGVSYVELKLWGVPKQHFSEMARILRKHKCEYVQLNRRWFCPLTELDSLTGELAPFIFKSNEDRGLNIEVALQGGLHG